MWPTAACSSPGTAPAAGRTRPGRCRGMRPAARRRAVADGGITMLTGRRRGDMAGPRPRRRATEVPELADVGGFLHWTTRRLHIATEIGELTPALSPRHPAPLFAATPPAALGFSSNFSSRKITSDPYRGALRRLDALPDSATAMTGLGSPLRSSTRPRRAYLRLASPGPTALGCTPEDEVRLDDQLTMRGRPTRFPCCAYAVGSTGAEAEANRVLVGDRSWGPTPLPRCSSCCRSPSPSRR